MFLRRRYKWLWRLSILAVLGSFLFPWGASRGSIRSGFLWFSESDVSVAQIFLWGMSVQETIRRESFRGSTTTTANNLYLFCLDFQVVSTMLIVFRLILIMLGRSVKAAPIFGGIFVVSAVVSFLYGVQNIPGGNVSVFTFFGYGSISTVPSFGYMLAIIGALFTILLSVLILVDERSLFGYKRCVIPGCEDPATTVLRGKDGLVFRVCEKHKQEERFT